MKHANFMTSANTSQMLLSKLDGAQGRTFGTLGPLFAVFLANFLAKAAVAKYTPYFPFSLSLESGPWLGYNRPTPIHQTPETPNTDWHPISGPQAPIPEQYEDYYPEATTDWPEELQVAESNVRRKTNYRRTTPPPSRRRYPQRRRTTTPEPEYYESYEDNYQSYDDDYYGSVEQTTRYNHRRPTRPLRRRPPYNNPRTEIVIVRQSETTTAAPTTTEAATTTTTTTQAPSTTTTTELTTIITNGTTTESQMTTGRPSSSPSPGGYGPSNGNEIISITYGPPYHHYSAPYVNWYNRQDVATRNAIVKKVHDIVGFDGDFLRADVEVVN